MIAGALLFTRGGVTNAFLLNLLFYIIITPVIALTLTKIMYMSENNLIVTDALERIDTVLNAKPMETDMVPQHPQDASVELKDVHFSYDGKTEAIRGGLYGLHRARRWRLWAHLAAENPRWPD